MNTLLPFFLLMLVTFPVLGRAFYQKANLPGVFLAFGVALPAWYLGKALPIMGGAVFGILLGMLLAFVKRPSSVEPGLKAVSKKVLQAAIVLFGFEMNLSRVLEVGGQSLLLMLFTLSAAFLTAWLGSRLLRLEPVTSVLVGVGTAICGGSAIAAVAPVVRAKDEEVATAISTIFLFNVMAVFLFPAMGHAMGMSDLGFGMWAGTAINDTSSVVAAAYSYSDAAGGMATIVKLARTLMIIPVTFALALYTAGKERSEGSNFKMSRVFPWFVLGFAAASLAGTLGVVPVETAKFLGQSGKFLIVAAMASIGLGTRLDRLLKNSKKPILLGGLCWFAVSAASLLAQKALGLI